MDIIGTPKTLSKPKDIVAQITGDFGRWQLRTVLLIFICKIPAAWFIYTAPTPKKGEYYCKPPDELNTSITDHRAWVRVALPHTNEWLTDRQFHVDACNIYVASLGADFARQYANYTNPFVRPGTSVKAAAPTGPGATTVHVNVIPCRTFTHNSEYVSLVTQFDLVCSRELLVSVTQSFHALGALIGGLFAVKALKHISPRRLMLIGMLLQIVCGNLTGLVHTFQLHVYFRCLTSLFCVLVYTSGQVILADITAGQANTIVTTLFELFWSIGLILLPGISIFFDSWSYLYVAISSSAIILVFLHRWIADSPRWLLQHNEIDKALQILLQSAAYNNREIHLNLESQLKTYAKEIQVAARPQSYWTIWDGKTERKFVLSIHWAWVGAAVLYNVMFLLIRSLGVEHIHVNTVSLGFAEMLGVFVGLFLILYTRHRWLWIGYIMIAAGMLTYFIWLVPYSIKENRRVGLELIFWIILKLANSASFSVLTTCTGELVSNEKRPMLMLSVATFSRLCLVVAPFISTLTLLHQLLPITVFATLAICNGLLMCFLNRTFWNNEQPRIQKVLTPNTYRRNSAIVLLHRNSTCSDLNSDDTTSTLGFYDNPLKISIAELWHMEPISVEQDRCRTEVEETKNL